MTLPFISNSEKRAVLRVLESKQLVQGKQVSKFEKSFTRVAGTKFSVALNSGTSALHAGLLASGVGPGDEVIVPSFTFAASANSISLTGAKPIFADVDINTYCIDPIHIEELITKKTKGIMPVHLFGNSANMTEIVKIAKKHRLEIYEDAAQAHGAKHNGTLVGSFGKFGVFSFYPTKNVMAIEGGIVSTNDSEIQYQVKLLRNQGMIKQYYHELVGYNYRLSEVHAAVGNIQLKRLQKFTRRRIEIAKYYDINLTNCIVPYRPASNKHVYNQYTVRLPDLDRDRVANELIKKKIATKVYYPIPTHAQRAYQSKIDLPVTNALSGQVLSLPIHPNLTANEQDFVIENFNKITSVGY